MRDTQRSKVYAWERAVIPDWTSGRKLTLAECSNLVRRVWSDYRPEAHPPRVKDGRGCRWAWGGRVSITLPVWARHVPVVLHEVAHSLANDRHGPDFTRLFIELLVRYYWPDGKAELLATARARRIKIGKVADCPKPVRRRGTRPAYEKRPCRPHEWARGGEIKSELTRLGYVVRFKAICRRCDAVREPSVTSSVVRR